MPKQFTPVTKCGVPYAQKILHPLVTKCGVPYAQKVLHPLVTKCGVPYAQTIYPCDEMRSPLCYF